MKCDKHLLVAVDNVGVFPEQILNLDVPTSQVSKNSRMLTVGENVILSQLLSKSVEQAPYANRIGCVCRIININERSSGSRVNMQFRASQVVQISADFSNYPKSFEIVNYQPINATQAEDLSHPLVIEALKTKIYGVLRVLKSIAVGLPELQEGLENWICGWSHRFKKSLSLNQRPFLLENIENFIYQAMKWCPLSPACCQKIIEFQKVSEKLAHLKKCLGDYKQLVQLSNADSFLFSHIRASKELAPRPPEIRFQPISRAKRLN
jgi:hypothetical protein